MIIEPTTTLRLTRTFTAPRERVFHAWTDEAALRRWWWPRPTIQIDPRAGGTYYFEDATYGVGVSGVFLEFEPPRRLVYTWRWDGEESQTTVTVEFHDLGDSTEVVLVHDGFDSPGSHTDHRVGWSDCLDRLDVELAGAHDAGVPDEAF